MGQERDSCCLLQMLRSKDGLELGRCRDRYQGRYLDRYLGRCYLGRCYLGRCYLQE